MPRYLMTHDYGMGSLLWWVEAASEEEVLDTFAEVSARRPEGDESERLDDLAVLHVADPSQDDEAAAGLRATRAAQRGHPDYARLVGLEVVHLDLGSAYGEGTCLVELDALGHRLRMVEPAESGDGWLRSDEDDWVFNPPEDLRNPELVAHRISAEEFEERWLAAASARDAEEQ